MWQGKSALNTITCVVFDGYSTNISELYATQQDAIHEVYEVSACLLQVLRDIIRCVCIPGSFDHSCPLCTVCLKYT
jgi:hypothetical protein